MRKNMKEKIQNLLYQYERISLFHENDDHFGTVFRAVTKKYDGYITSLEAMGGGR